jgi:hypothetical protein
MDPKTGALYTKDEAQHLDDLVRSRIVPVPKRLRPHAEAMLAFRNAERQKAKTKRKAKALRRTRRRQASRSHRKNRG